MTRGALVTAVRHLNTVVDSLMAKVGFAFLFTKFAGDYALLALRRYFEEGVLIDVQADMPFFVGIALVLLLLPCGGLVRRYTRRFLDGLEEVAEEVEE